MALTFVAAGAACDRGANPLAPAGATLSQDSAATSSQTAPIVVDGIWRYREDTDLVFSGELASPARAWPPRGRRSNSTARALMAC